MNILLTILLVILGIVAVLFFFGFTIFIHEFGHFLAGKLLGLKAPIFSIGFGPSIFKKKFGETEFRISVIPLGGYVSLPELDPTGMEIIQGDGKEKVEEVKPAIWWKRIIVAAAGPLGNVLFAIVLAYIVAACPVQSNVPKEVRLPQGGYTIGYVEPNTDVAESGLRAGDVVHEVNGRSVEIFSEFMQEVHLGSVDGYATVCVSNMFDGAEACLRVPVEKLEGEKYFSIKHTLPAQILILKSVFTNSPAESVGLKEMDYIFMANGKRIISGEVLSALIEKGDSINFTVYRDGNFIDLTVTPEYNEEHKRNLIGISYGYAIDNVKSWTKYRKPWDQLKGDAQSIFRILDSLFTPKEKGEASRTAGALGGPISIITVMWFNVVSGFVSFLAFIRFLNINLAILNLLPIPILDGGHIIFALWRGIFGRELPEKVITILCNGFAMLLIAFFIFVSCNDVINVKDVFFSKNEPAEEQAQPDPIEEPVDNSSEKELSENEEYVEVIEEGE